MIGGFVKAAQTRARTLLWRLRRRLGRPMTPGDGLRILFYHRVADDPGDPLVVTCDVFAAEMALLAERGYEVVDVVEALDRLYAGTLESKTIALTFDDGYVDNVVHAMPVLERHGFRGTVFVVTDLVSGKGAFAKGHGSPAPLLGWAEIERLDGKLAADVRGAHGHPSEPGVVVRRGELGGDRARPARARRRAGQAVGRVLLPGGLPRSAGARVRPPRGIPLRHYDRARSQHCGDRSRSSSGGRR